MKLPKLRPEIIYWSPGVTLGEARETIAATVRRHSETFYQEDWWRIGGTAVACCKDCGVVLAGKNGLRRHNNLHEQLINLQEDIQYLYQHLGIGSGDGEHGESTEDSATGAGGEVHETG